MINHIYGKVVFTSKNYIILESNGLGFKLNVKDSNDCKVGEYKRMYIHCITKTDTKNCINTEFYGFHSPVERNLFTQLISISGIGPVTATNLIDAGYKNVIKYIVNEDIDSLISIKGVNEKIARQIIAVLIEQCLKIAEALNISSNTEQDNEFVDALKQLGYNNHEINFALKSIDQNLDLDEKIGKSIKMIALNHGNN